MKKITTSTLQYIIFLPSTLYKNTSFSPLKFITLKNFPSSFLSQIYFCGYHAYSNFMCSTFALSEISKDDFVFFTNVNQTSPPSQNLTLDNFKLFLSNLTKHFLINLNKTLFISSSDIELAFLKELNLPSVAYQNPYFPNQELFQTSYLFEDISDFDMQNLSIAYQRFYHLPVTILDTKRLTLRELTVEDMKQLFKIYQNTSITKFIPSETSLLELKKKQMAYIKNHYSFYEYGLWGVFLKNTNTLIGRCGLQQAPELPLKIKLPFIDTTETILELSYLIDTPFQKQGYALEITKAILNYANHNLNFHNIISFIAPENLSSIKLAKRLNMKPSEMVFYNGYDCIIYYIDFKKKYLMSREHSLCSFSNHPDTRVYGKRYHIPKSFK